MKTKLFSLLFAALLFSSLSFAKIWRVNNNVGVTADFTTAQAANNAASVMAGDTIHLEPSITTYGGLSCTKRLTWISTGAFLNVHPNEQFSQNVGKIDALTVTQAGSANSVFHVYVNGPVDLQASGLRVDRCFAGGAIGIQNYTFGAAPNNIVVINSYFKGVLNCNFGNNTVITNNIFEDGFEAGSSNTLAVITHNVFNAFRTNVGTVNNAIVENNIFNKAGSAYTFNNSTRAVSYLLSLIIARKLSSLIFCALTQLKNGSRKIKKAIAALTAAEK